MTPPSLRSSFIHGSIILKSAHTLEESSGRYTYNIRGFPSTSQPALPPLQDFPSASDTRQNDQGWSLLPYPYQEPPSTYTITSESNSASSSLHQTPVGLLKNHKPLTSGDSPAWGSSMGCLCAHWSPCRASVLLSDSPSQQVICLPRHLGPLVWPLMREDKLSWEVGLIGVVLSVDLMGQPMKDYLISGRACTDQLPIFG